MRERLLFIGNTTCFKSRGSGVGQGVGEPGTGLGLRVSPSQDIPPMIVQQIIIFINPSLSIRCGFRSLDNREAFLSRLIPRSISSFASASFIPSLTLLKYPRGNTPKILDLSILFQNKLIYSIIL